MENVCRICFEENDLIKVGCLCSGRNNLIHYQCAKKWFSKIMVITISGKIPDINWNVSIKCLCEICQGNVNQSLCIKIYNEYKKIKN